MVLVLQLLIVGLATGAIYALIALGYTMVYGIIELINFAHGDIFMIGTFVSLTFLTLLGIVPRSVYPTGFALVAVLVATCIVAMLVCAVLGVVIERIAYKPLRNAPRLAPLISAIGVSLILEDVGKLWKGNNNVPFPQIFPNVQYNIGPITFSGIYVFVFVVALLLMVALQWLITRTKMGRAMRAVAQDREAAALMGVNVDRIISFTFFIGAALAGAAGFIYALDNGSTIFTIGFNLGLIAFTAAVLGGIGNILGAMLGGLLIGVIESLTTLIPDTILPHGGTAWSRAIIFAILILILVFRPSGLLGQQTPDKV
ncbi:MAG: branched-chain amino acid ABC transporter permease [Ktedonobacteraceae bacterium]|nr:branched-chain amino acid ABC transporter permease [Ktedonobacteraceae bacterium]